MTDIQKPLWLDLQPLDIKSHNWKSAQVVNSHLVCDPTICQPGFDLPRQQWTDGQTDILPRHSPHYAYASSGKDEIKKTNKPSKMSPAISAGKVKTGFIY